MIIKDLIKLLEQHDPEAEICLKGREPIEIVYLDKPEILSDNSSYPVVLLLEDHDVKNRATCGY